MSGTGFGARSPGHWVVVTTSFPTRAGDASGHFVAAEVRRLREQGHRVTVLAPDVTSDPPSDPDVRWLPAGDAFGWPGAIVRLKERPRRVLGVVRFVLGARRELARIEDAERIVAHFAVPCAWPIASRRPRPPLEVVAHGSDVRLIERLPRLIRRLIARSLRGAHVRCASHELRARLERSLAPVAAVRFSVAPPAFELTTAPSRRDARAMLGVSPGTRLFVVVGRLVASKRVEVALRAAELVPAALVVVVGDGPERAHLERRFSSVRFLGRVARPEALRWIAAADVLLSASRLEGAPTVVREARALGVPVVAVPAGDLGAWSRHDAGLYVLEAFA